MENPPKARKSFSQAMATNPNNPTAGIAEASLGFERTYRLHGAISTADKRQRYGNYFDFFWRVKRPANVTIRLEYREGKLPPFVQAPGVSYEKAEGKIKTGVTGIGGDYFLEGRGTAWGLVVIVDRGRLAQKS